MSLGHPGGPLTLYLPHHLIKLLSREPVRDLSAHPATRVCLIQLLSLGHPTGPLTICPSHHSCLSHQTPLTGPPNRSTLTLCPSHHTCLSYQTPLTGPPNRSTNSLPIPPRIYLNKLLSTTNICDRPREKVP